MIHDAQFDYFGKRVATASSDRTIKLFSLSGDKQTFLCDLKGHEGPVWQVSWAHPKHGTILASCSYDGKVIIWKETQGWKINYVKVLRQNGPAPIPVNSISWAPSSFGLVLAAATADGFISILSFSEEKKCLGYQQFSGSSWWCECRIVGPGYQNRCFSRKKWFYSTNENNEISNWRLR